MGERTQSFSLDLSTVQHPVIVSLGCVVFEGKGILPPNAERLRRGL
jgi:hypothetical protein